MQPQKLGTTFYRGSDVVVSRGLYCVMQLRLLAIGCIMMMMAVRIAVDAKNLMKRNRRVIGSLFRREDFDLFGNWGRTPLTTTTTATTEADFRASHTIILGRAKKPKLNGRSSRKSLKSLSRPVFFEDQPIDPESLKPHVRVKRNNVDNNHHPLSSRSPSYVHRVPRRTYERFLSEEMNPADESEAEYGSNLDDDIDVPGIFLNDEITNKRNRLEDVYPDVKRDHSPPEFLKSSSDSAARPKRNKERQAECADGEEDEEYYYDDEDETANRKAEVRDADAKAAPPISASRQSVDRSNQEDSQTFENAAVNRVNSVGRKKFSAAGVKKSKPVGMSTADKSNRKNKNHKAQPRKKPPVPKKSNGKSAVKSKAHTQKGKTRQMPKAKSKPRSQSKSNVATLIDNESEQLINQEDYAECCGRTSDKKNNKITKTLVVEAVPTSESMQELQIFEKPSSKKLESKSKTMSKLVKDNNQMSMGEMKDLLTRLIGKIDDLHNIVSELRNDRAVSRPDRINCIAKSRRRTSAGA